MSVSMHWILAKAGDNTKQRESAAEKFFDSDAGTNRAEDLVREGLQNSIDAKRKDVKQVRVRICFGTLSSERAKRYAEGLEPHIPKLIHLRPSLKVLNGPCRYLVFEDFGTTGLTGDKECARNYEGKNAFHTFFRAECKTDKTHGQLGSHGIGKVAFMAASQAHMVLGLTYTFDLKETLFLGTAVLRSHELNGQDYECDAWYGLPGSKVVMPSSAAADIDRFREDFHLTRGAEEPGFSVVVPWLEEVDDDDDQTSAISADQIIDAIIRGHAFPILEGALAVEVIDAACKVSTMIDRDSFFKVLATRSQEIQAEYEPMARLAQWSLSIPECVVVAQPEGYSPKWSEVKIDAKLLKTLRLRFEAGEKLAFRVELMLRHKKKDAVSTWFHVYLIRTIVQGTVLPPMTHFQRRHLLISGMTQRNSSVAAFVMVDHEHINDFVRSAENVAHTKWDTKPITKDYTYASAFLTYLVKSVSGLTKLLSGDPAVKDKLLWADDLSLPMGALPPGRDGDSGGGGGDVVETEDDPTVDPTVIPPLIVSTKPYQIVAVAGGFRIGPSGKPFPALPAELDLQMGYHVRGKNPIKRWRKEDFDFGVVKKKGEIKFDNKGCSIAKREGNRLKLKIVAPDFNFTATGFDSNRDLFFLPKLVTATDTDTEGTVSDEA